MADISILDPASRAAPKAYKITGAQEIVLKGVTAAFDGSAATSQWVPALQVLDPSGFVVGTYVTGTTQAAGSSVGVSWYPGASVAAAPTASAASIFRLISLNTTNASAVKAAPGVVSGWFLSNQNAATRYVKLYNIATAPTVGTTTPVLTIAIPGGASANVGFPEPISFATGIGLGTTTGVADGDTGAVAANDVVVNLFFS